MMASLINVNTYLFYYICCSDPVIQTRPTRLITILFYFPADDSLSWYISCNTHVLVFALFLFFPSEFESFFILASILLSQVFFFSFIDSELLHLDAWRSCFLRKRVFFFSLIAAWILSFIDSVHVIFGFTSMVVPYLMFCEQGEKKCPA